MKKYKSKFKEAEKKYVNVDFKQIGNPIIGKKITEIRKLLGKDVLGFVLEDNTGIIIRISKKGNLEILPVSEFTQTEITFKM